MPFDFLHVAITVALLLPALLLLRMVAASALSFLLESAGLSAPYYQTRKVVDFLGGILLLLGGLAMGLVCTGAIPLGPHSAQAFGWLATATYEAADWLISLMANLASR